MSDRQLINPSVARNLSRTDSYWGEFVGLNAPWFFIPVWAIYESTQATARAFRLADAYAADDLSTARGPRKDTDEGLPFLGHGGDQRE